MNKTRVILIIIIVVICFCSVVQISASNELSTKGIEVSAIQTKIDSVKKENTLLKEQVYSFSSYNKIASDAATLGFIPEKAPLFVESSYPIAIRQ